MTAVRAFPVTLAALAALALLPACVSNGDGYAIQRLRASAARADLRAAEARAVASELGPVAREAIGPRPQGPIPSPDQGTRVAAPFAMDHDNPRASAAARSTIGPTVAGGIGLELPLTPRLTLSVAGDELAPVEALTMHRGELVISGVVMLGTRW